MTSRDTRALARLLLCFLTVAALVGGLAAPATAAPTSGSITGTITVPAPFHAYEVRVHAQPEDGSDEITAYPADDGTYTLDLDPGRYKIQFDHASDLGDPLRDEWHPNQDTEATATWVTVTAGGTQTIDASLEESTGLGTVTGKVTWPNGTPADQALVYIYRPRAGGGFDATFQYARTDGTFTYQLKPGTYRLEFNPGHDYLVSEFWRNQPPGTVPTAATPVVVTSGSSLTADAELACPSTCATASITADGGTPAVGRTLRASSQGWDLDEPLDPTRPHTLTHVWMRDGVEIAGQTGGTYTPTAADVGKRISVRLVDNGWMGPVPDIAKTITSPPTAAVVSGTLTTATPTISGSPAVGSTLTANPGTWAPAGVTTTIQWLRNGVPIPRATTRTYRLTTADLDRTVSVRVDGSATGYASATTTSGGLRVKAATSRIAVKAQGAKRQAKFVVRVSAAGVTPAGVVQVKLGSRTVAKGALRGGAAVLRAKKLPKGKRVFTVRYLGRDGVAGSTTRTKVKIR